MKTDRIIKSRLLPPYWLKRVKHVIKRSIIMFNVDLYWRLRYLALGYPEPELPLIDTFCAKDLTAVDVGANYGMYTYYASRRFETCYAFEPQPYFLRVLKKAFSKANVHIFQTALSNREGTGVMRIPLCDRGYGTIDHRNQLDGKVDESDGIESFEVKTSRLDDYQFERVGFLKVDVEGHEMEVLQGARETIVTWRPAIFVEVEERHRAGSVQAVASLLKEMEYHCFFILHKKLLPFDAFTLEGNQNSALPREYVRNFIFLHKEKIPASLFPNS